LSLQQDKVKVFKKYRVSSALSLTNVLPSALAQITGHDLSQISKALETTTMLSLSSDVAKTTLTLSIPKAFSMKRLRTLYYSMHSSGSRSCLWYSERC